MKQFESNGKKYLAVEVPACPNNCRLVHPKGRPSQMSVQFMLNGNVISQEELPESEWQILGLCPELSEVDCAGIVESAYNPFFNSSKIYKDYEPDSSASDFELSAQMSLLGLIRFALGLDWEKTLILEMK